jgi:FKBP-type peptidyl-prolyl cis-trans isomerase FklB
MKKMILLLAVTITVTGSFAQVKKKSATPVTQSKTTVAGNSLIKTSSDSAGYALGIRIAQNLKGQNLDKINLSLFQKAMNDVFLGKKPAIADSLLDQSINRFQQKAQAQKAGKAIEEGKLFLAKNAKRPGVVTLPSGMQYEIMKAGSDTAPKPSLTSKVKCHYHGTLINGKVFDSSVDRGEPVTFPLDGVIRGWQEALQLMNVGSKWRLFIPPSLAYGNEPSGPIPGGSTLIFEVELLGIEQ